MNTRRDFLRASAALSLGGLLSVRADEPQTGWQLGCYTRPWDQYELNVALDGIAEAGFPYVGIMTAKGKTWVVITTKTTPEEAAQIGAAVRQRGLKTLSVYGDFPASTEIEPAIKNLKLLIDHCVACGSPHLLLGGTGDPKLVDPYYKTIAECCDYAQSKGVGLSIKPHGGQNSTGPQCRQLIERVHHPNFRLTYDPGNIFYYSDGKRDPVDDAATVDGIVAGMCVKDFRDPKEVLVTPGTGRVRFAEVLARLKQGGFTHGPLIVECLDKGDAKHVTDEARKALRFLKELTGQS